MSIRLFLTGTAILMSAALSAQHTETHRVSSVSKDTSLGDFISKAHWSAHSRTFFMSTVNEGELKDDYALGSGAGISLETKPFHGFQVGLSGFFIYNVMSSPIHEPDELSKAPNRYEVGLFDIEDHENKNDLDRLEELFLRYNFSKSSISVGKMVLNTPFMNPQDGRMRPTVEEGVWLNMHESDKIGFNGGWIWDISPRSTVSWYSVAGSMGVFPMGVTPEGSKSDYRHHIEGNTGLGIANLYYKPSKGLKIELWNGMLENVMNTAVAEISAEQKKGKNTYYQGLILMRQDAINNGGNADPRKTYMEKGAQSNAVSAQAGIRNQRFNHVFAYTHITDDGRYLMPREWGKEVFYTFMPRERIEGYGNVHAAMARSTITFNKQFNAGLAYSFVKLPDVLDFRLNKYGMPSYHQINLSANYKFQHFLQGMELKLLVAGKLQQGETYDQPKYVYNKVNMVNFNLILDYKI